MGSPVSPIVANLYIEYFEQKALSTAPPPKIWHNYVDDTWVVQKEEKQTNFLQHINSIDLAIWSTVEDNKEDGAISFLDTIVKSEANGKLSITVYRKPTNTDQYLQWNTHHHPSAKYSVINTLTYRAKTVCNKPELLQKEIEHLRKALTHCKCPKWALNRVEKRLTKPPCEVVMGLTVRALQPPNPLLMISKTKGHIVIPYTQGLCKSIKQICSRYGIQTNFKGNITFKNLLSLPQGQESHGQQK